MLDRRLDEAGADAPAALVGAYHQAGNLPAVPLGQTSGDDHLQATGQLAVRRGRHEDDALGVGRRCADTPADRRA